MPNLIVTPFNEKYFSKIKVEIFSAKAITNKINPLFKLERENLQQSPLSIINAPAK